VHFWLFQNLKFPKLFSCVCLDKITVSYNCSRHPSFKNKISDTLNFWWVLGLSLSFSINCIIVVHVTNCYYCFNFQLFNIVALIIWFKVLQILLQLCYLFIHINNKDSDNHLVPLALDETLCCRVQYIIIIIIITDSSSFMCPGYYAY